MLVRIALSALAASCDCACYDQASCIGAAGGPCARCAPAGAIGRLLAHLLCTFVCEANDTDDYLVACFWCSFADSDCAFCAGCQLRLRMARSGMMHRGCGRPVRTLRTFCDDRAAPSAPVLYFVCAKEMTPIMWPAFGAPLLIRIALSALDASCDCAWHDQASCIGAAGGPCARCAPFCAIGRLRWHLLCTFCVRRK